MNTQKPPRKGSRLDRMLRKAAELGREAARGYDGSPNHHEDRGRSTRAYVLATEQWNEWSTLTFCDQPGFGRHVTPAEGDAAHDAMWKAYEEERAKVRQEKAAAVDRQTHTKLLGGSLGNVTLLRHNGPTVLVLEDGTRQPVRVIDEASKSVIVRLPDGSDRAMAILDPGIVHQRYWSPLLGPGWLVHLAAYNLRFDPDDGRAPVPLHWKTMEVGTPEYAMRNHRRSNPSPVSEEDGHWITLTLRDGTVMGFRRDGAPPPAQQPAATTAKANEPQGTLPGVG